jgi:hypothetical protein
LADGKNANNDPKELQLKKQTVKKGAGLKIVLANNGGFVAMFKLK